MGPVRKSLGHVAELAAQLELDTLQPHSKLSSTHYCLANPGEEYVVYAPAGGTITLDTSAVKKGRKMKWKLWNPTDGRSRHGADGNGPAVVFRCPWKGDAVLHVTFT